MGRHRLVVRLRRRREGSQCLRRIRPRNRRVLHRLQYRHPICGRQRQQHRFRNRARRKDQRYRPARSRTQKRRTADLYPKPRTGHHHSHCRLSPELRGSRPDSTRRALGRQPHTCMVGRKQHRGNRHLRLRCRQDRGRRQNSHRLHLRRRQRLQDDLRESRLGMGGATRHVDSRRLQRRIFDNKPAL